MAYKEIAVGADRFLALKWANYAFDLCRQQVDEESAELLLREYLDHETNSAIMSRKTTNQLKRLWLSYQDSYQVLREKAISLTSLHQRNLLPVLHLGLAMNVFPIYQETVNLIGVLHNITKPLLSKTIVERVLEKFPNPTSIPYTVPKLLRTLKDWGFIVYEKGEISVNDISLEEEDFVNWFMFALVIASDQHEMTLQQLALCPLKLGIRLAHPRKVITQSDDLILSRNSQGIEVIRRRK